MTIQRVGQHEQACADVTTTPPWEPSPGTDERPRSTVGNGRRLGLTVALLGLVSVVAVYAPIMWLQSQGRSAAAIVMPDMGMQRMGVFWAFPLLQATGIAALGWAYAAIVLGLLESGRLHRTLGLTRRQLDRLHHALSLLVIALIAAHIVATVFDAMGDSLTTVLVPGKAAWAASRLAYDLGIFAFYLALLLGPTYFLAHRFGGRLGNRVWRFAHRFVIIVYVLSVWHTLIIGADVEHYGWARPVLWLAQLPLLGLLALRLLHPAARTSAGPFAVTTRYAVAAGCIAAAVAITGAVVTGHAATIVHSIQ